MSAQPYTPLYPGGPSAADLAAHPVTSLIQPASDGRISTSLGHGFANYLLRGGYQVYGWVENNLVGLMVGAVALYVIFATDVSSSVQGRL